MSNKKNESTELQTVSESGDVPTSDVVEATADSFVTPDRKWDAEAGGDASVLGVKRESGG